LRRALIAVLVSTVLIGVAAAPASAESTRAEYIAQADPICAAGSQGQINAIRGLSSDIKRGQLGKAARKIRRGGAIFSGAIEQVAALEPPAADSQLIAAWIDSLRAQPPIINRFAGALGHGNAKPLKKLANQLLSVDARTKAMVADYGFQACNGF
jgi:hypothetical protein